MARNNDGRRLTKKEEISLTLRKPIPTIKARFGKGLGSSGRVIEIKRKKSKKKINSDDRSFGLF